MAVTQGVTHSLQRPSQCVERGARLGVVVLGLVVVASCVGTHPVGGNPGAAGSSLSTGAAGNPFALAGASGTTTGGAGRTGTSCMQGKYEFVPKTPTVFLLVNQSGSMFGCRTNGGAKSPTANECASRADTSWYPLRDGVLQVVQTLGAEVRFGFAAFTGEAGDAMCPQLAPVTPALGNFAAISSRYNALVAPRKGETPTRNALASVGALLAADQAPGEKFILFVTDGQPDYCDDGNELCPPDSVVGREQRPHARQGVARGRLSLARRNQRVVARRDGRAKRRRDGRRCGTWRRPASPVKAANPKRTSAPASGPPAARRHAAPRRVGAARTRSPWGSSRRRFVRHPNMLPD